MPYAASRHARRLAGCGAALIVTLAATAYLVTDALAACSCTDLKISHGNAATVKLCSDNDLNFAECARAAGSGANGCAGSTYAYTCPVGVNSTAVALKQKTGFEADATLTGTAGECESGQALQLTITSNETVQKPKVHATPSGDVTVGNYTVTINNDRRYKYPDVGATSAQKPLYGADSYTDPAAADLLMQRTGTHLKWWDNTDQEKDKASEAATWNYRFFSYVKGSAGQNGCGCVFDIDVGWPANTAATTTFTSVGGSSTRCTF